MIASRLPGQMICIISIFTFVMLVWIEKRHRFHCLSMQSITIPFTLNMADILSIIYRLLK